MHLRITFENQQDWPEAIRQALERTGRSVSRAQVRAWIKSERVYQGRRPLRLSSPLQDCLLELRGVPGGGAAPLGTGLRGVPGGGAAPPGSRLPEPQILWRDQDLIAVAKPAGMLSHPGAAPGRANLVEWLREQGEFEQLVMQHRLDKDTSGLLLFSHSRRACAPLAQIVAEHAWEKTYLARVAGSPPPRGKIDAPLAEVSGRVRLDSAGKPACTSFRRRPSGILEVYPQQGRKHQIRVHLASRGWPIVGDTRYAGPVGERLWLHAWRLRLTHPIHGTPLELTCAPGPGWE